MNINLNVFHHKSLIFRFFGETPDMNAADHIFITEASLTASFVIFNKFLAHSLKAQFRYNVNH